MSISVVIPAFNEGRGIERCLQRVSQQGDDVIEIVVVDNASTDDTADLVRRAADTDPRIRLVHEPRPGVAHARYRGFAETRGEIIASLDCDTLVEPGWAAAVAATFAGHPEVMAGTAPMPMWDLPFQRPYRFLHRRLESTAHARLARGIPLRAPGLSGANSAIRRSAWEDIAGQVSTRSDVFEDLDRWLLLREHGHHTVVVPGMSAVVSGRRLLSSPRSIIRYAMCGPRTYAVHGRWGMVGIASVVNTVSVLVTMVKLPVNRAWDPHHRRFSLRRAVGRDLEIRDSPIG
ncbi:glycosyltransferase family 2 protein [Williamsia deligens]|uniref:Glycosyltransferase family 2 protein n=1 Tax=Williamsia deligens TaxID=321325 RepID=A0ABW3G7I9_9NOCA|nr:glycosyltransferase family A protein [Williamsia deligens]